MKPQNASLAVSVKGPEVPRTVLVAPPSRFAKRIEVSAETRRPVAMRFMESSLGGEGTPLSTGSQGSRLPASSRHRHSGPGELEGVSLVRWYNGEMARPLRVEVAGGLYHVIVRGNERKAVFRDDADRREYLRRLAHYAEKFESRLVAYCLMDNHVHLAIERGKGLLSRIMAGLQSSYTQFFNRRHRRVG